MSLENGKRDANVNWVINTPIMVSPCIGTRLSPSKGNTPFYSQSQFVVGTIQQNPPLEFRIPKSNGKTCGHPKQGNSRTKNSVSSQSRKLGNVRSTLISGSYASEVGVGNDEIAFARSEILGLKQTVGSSSSSNTTDGSSEYENRDKERRLGSFAIPTRQWQKDAKLSSNSTMLTNSRHKKTYASSMSSFHEQTVPDARQDPYNVHKWRRKSSRRKYAGMESSPILAQKLKQDTEFRKDADISEFAELLPEDRAIKFLSELTKKPRVPLPGRNMLPSLHLHPRSETGNSGREEISLRFARNMAMEQLEKQFYDSRSKTNHMRNSKRKENIDAPLGNARREYIHNMSLRRAGYLVPIHSRHRLDVTQTNSIFDSSSATSPAKNSPFQPEWANGEFSNDGYIQRGEKFVGKDVVWTTLSNGHDEAKIDDATYTTTQDVEQNGIINDARKFQVFDESFSEETVTIITKPSVSLSPTKQDDSGSTQNFDATLFQVHKSADQTLRGDTKTDNIAKQSDASTTYLPAGKRYQKLRNLTHDESSPHVGSKYNSRVKRQPFVSNRHANFARSCQNNQKSLGHEAHLANMFGKRSVLPPIHSVENSFNNEGNVDRKRARQKITKQSTEVASLSPSVRSPVSKKSLSPKNSPLSHASNFSYGTKDSQTTGDSIRSQKTGGRRKSRKWRRFSRVESKGSPQFQKALKQSKLAKLMGRWRIVIKTVIMINRLYNDHHIMSDDSYNIHFVSLSQQKLENDVQKEVLFDLSDYKMKNQQKLSDTTRKILTTLPEQRTHQDVKIIQTTLRNLKAVSDHSANVQMNIAKHGYVVRLNSKRVVVLENRVPLNFYILLAGSAVMIKKDESGNTNPISFIKRGDVFGEREILNNEKWNWSVVSVDPCEFLLLDRNDYIRIFVDGGMGGLLNDPDRGTFMKNLTLFRGWPMELIKSNPNRCIFRYFKRGALLARDGEESEWIFVIKSGSCSVVKPIKVGTYTTRQIFANLMDEQTAKFSASLQGDLVERIGECTKEEHQLLLDVIATEMEANKPVTTSYQKMEMASLLKEFNIELKNAPLTPVEEEDENAAKDSSVRQTEDDHEPSQVNTALASAQLEEFRMRRVSDRAIPPRTPSPMKAAYLQTGYSSPTIVTAKHSAFVEGNSRTMQDNTRNLPTGASNDTGNMQQTHEMNAAIDTNVSDDSNGESNVVFGMNESNERNERNSTPEKQKSVYISLRQLTKGSSFGLDSIIFGKQQNMALVSNGAECLLLNKKFYFDNVTEEVLKNLREAEHPYPSDTDLLESYWRLLTWKFFKKRVMREVYRRNVDLRRR